MVRLFMAPSGIEHPFGHRRHFWNVLRRTVQVALRAARQFGRDVGDMAVWFLWRTADVGVVFVWSVWDALRGAQWTRGRASVRREFPAVARYGLAILFSILVGCAIARLTP